MQIGDLYGVVKLLEGFANEVLAQRSISETRLAPHLLVQNVLAVQDVLMKPVFLHKKRQTFKLSIRDLV